MAWLGNARHGTARQARLGRAGLGSVRLGMAGPAWRGRAWLGPARHGRPGMARHGMARHGRQDAARLGKARLGAAWQGRHGKSFLHASHPKDPSVKVTWKQGTRVTVEAETAHQEFERIRQENGGELHAADVVAAARSEESPLHGEFEWDDSVAADKYRVTQAQTLIRCVVVTTDSDPEGKHQIRAYSKPTAEGVPSPYVSTEDLLKDPEARMRLIQEALDKLMQWRMKYRSLNELAMIHRAAEETMATLDV